MKWTFLFAFKIFFKWKENAHPRFLNHPLGKILEVTAWNSERQTNHKWDIPLHLFLWRGRNGSDRKIPQEWTSLEQTPGLCAPAVSLSYLLGLCLKDSTCHGQLGACLCSRAVALLAAQCPSTSQTTIYQSQPTFIWVNDWWALCSTHYRASSASDSESVCK